MDPQPAVSFLPVILSMSLSLSPSLFALSPFPATRRANFPVPWGRRPSQSHLACRPLTQCVHHRRHSVPHARTPPKRARGCDKGRTDGRTDGLTGDHDTVVSVRSRRRGRQHAQEEGRVLRPLRGQQGGRVAAALQERGERDSNNEGLRVTLVAPTECFLLAFRVLWWWTCTRTGAARAAR